MDEGEFRIWGFRCYEENLRGLLSRVHGILVIGDW